jgi:putative aldouronate transport system substrate-binding protein
MLDRSTTLETLEEETFVGIINGELPLDEFDNFVDQWKGLGGDDITAEVNEWWQNK